MKKIILNFNIKARKILCVLIYFKFLEIKIYFSFYKKEALDNSKVIFFVYFFSIAETKQNAKNK
jgi:hypothetical protein